MSTAPSITTAMPEQITLHHVEATAEAYARDREELSSIVGALQAVIDEARRRAMPEIREAVRNAAESRDRLRAMIEAAPELFDNPRTRVIAGVKLGFRKQKGKVEFDDEGKVIERIRAQLPKDQAELLIRVRESVHKPAVYDLTAGDLKRLGIRITDDCDELVIKPADSEVDKLVAALLDEAGEVRA
jgi:hypothetical protein